jgi:sugar phosphate isomerase/epimerase
MRRLCVHTITTKPLSLEECLVQFPKRGVSGITIWRQALEGRDLGAVARQTREAGLEVVSLCRGGFFPATTGAARQTRSMTIGRPLSRRMRLALRSSFWSAERFRDNR